MARSVWITLIGCLCGTASVAETASLYRPSGPAQPVIIRRAGVVEANTSPSLFIGIRDNSFFAPLPDPPVPVSAPLAGTTRTARLLSLIARAEAGAAGYDAVQHGARIRPAKAPTQMTLREIYAWIDNTPGQPHAIGRYQFIPATLKHVAAVAGIGPDMRFSTDVQDRLAMVLLQQAGIENFLTGDLPREAFMRNLAKIWAGLPLPNGQSYYHGYAGNRATMSWASFEGGMARIFPAVEG